MAADAGFPAASPTDVNTRIHVNYVPHWGLAEALREVVTNMFDVFAAYTVKPRKVPKIDTVPETATDPSKRVESTIDLFDAVPEFFVKALAHEDPANPGKLCAQGDFDILRTDTEEIAGTIRWKEKTLTLENPGSLAAFNFLMGGGTKTPGSGSDAKKGVSGQFGEGLKLAMLAVLRSRRIFRITSSGVVTTALLRTSGMKLQHQVCLHLDQQKDPRADANANKVIVEITNIELDEWIGTSENFQGVHGFLQLIGALKRVPGFEDDDPQEVHGVAGKEGGALLLNPRYRGCIFNNGVFLSRKPFLFGYALVGLTPNRDRHVLVDVGQQREKTARLLVDIIGNYHLLQTYGPDTVNLGRLDFFDLRDRVIKQLIASSDETWVLSGHLTPAAADSLFEFWTNLIEQAAVTAAAGPSSSTAPAHSTITDSLPFQHFRVMPTNNVGEVHKALDTQLLSRSVYPVLHANWQLNNCLVKSRYYRNIAMRKSDLMRIPPVETFTTASPPAGEFHAQVWRILSLLLTKSDRSTLEILFVDFKKLISQTDLTMGYAISFRQDKKIYVSSLLLDPTLVQRSDPGMEGNPAQICAIKIFATIIQLSDLKDLPQLFSKIFTTGVSVTTPELE